jgi:8-oxo-dGTP diphosphatase
MGESWETCIARELLVIVNSIVLCCACVYSFHIQEETNLTITNINHIGTTNDISIGGNPEKHYITILMVADIAPSSFDLVNMEPHKCEEWVWMSWDALLTECKENPAGIFDPILHFVENGGSLPPSQY